MILKTQCLCPISKLNLSSKIWRYMSFPKFITFLESSELYFSRADKFQDPYEGFHPIMTAPREEIKMTPFNDDELYISHKKLVEETYKFTFINSWVLSEYESAAMWDLYVNNYEGIAIKSTIKNLVETLEPASENIQICKVNYSDFSRGFKDEGNLLTPFINKRIPFEHEKELRAIIMDFPNGITDEALDKPIYENGIAVKIDLNDLIESIYIHPLMNNWIFEPLKSLITNKLDVPLIHSKLYDLK